MPNRFITPQEFVRGLMDIADAQAKRVAKEEGMTAAEEADLAKWLKFNGARWIANQPYKT